MAKGDFKRRLTKDNVLDLKGRPNQRTEYTDTVEKGLHLIVTENGSRSFLYQYRKDGKQRRYTIGNLDTIDLAGARLYIKAARKAGADPAIEKAAALRHTRISTVTPNQTFSELAAAFIADQKKEDSWAPSVEKEWTRIINKELVTHLGEMHPAAITAGNIRDLIDNIKKRPAKRTASYTFTIARRLFKWAIWKEIISVSPCVAAQPFERKRARFHSSQVLKPFTDEQLRALFRLSKGTELEDLLDLLARTGVRSHEARSARVDGIRDGVWSLAPHFHKNGRVTGRAHLVPLSTGALRVFKRLQDKATEWYFPAPCKCDICNLPGHMDTPNAPKLTTVIKKQAGIEGYGFLHRMRDTIKTRMSEHGTPERVSEFILGHILTGIAGKYDHAELLKERKEALEWWSQELDKILKGKKR